MLLGTDIVGGSNNIQKCADVIYGWPPTVIIGPIWKCNCKLRVATCSNRLYIPYTNRQKAGKARARHEQTS